MLRRSPWQTPLFYSCTLVLGHGLVPGGGFFPGSIRNELKYADFHGDFYGMSIELPSQGWLGSCRPAAGGGHDSLFDT
jgi:hypothetical protein